MSFIHSLYRIGEDAIAHLAVDFSSRSVSYSTHPVTIPVLLRALDGPLTPILAERWRRARQVQLPGESGRQRPARRQMLPRKHALGH